MPKSNTYPFSYIFFYHGLALHDNIIYGPGAIYSNYIYDTLVNLWEFSGLFRSSVNMLAKYPKINH